MGFITILIVRHLLFYYLKKTKIIARAREKLRVNSVQISRLLKEPDLKKKNDL